MSRAWTNFWYKLDAYLWWCEDEVCDCYQPRIDLAYPNLKAGAPWLCRVRVWEGTFRSEPSEEELEKMKTELAEAAWWFGIQLTKNKFGQPHGWQEIPDSYGKFLLAFPMETP